ncbi:uncharacterized protein LOC143258753 [Megalopta genalis]|uniref:uncharacterized protein LOC143258753 n=1 Tax=Megalopta genalis TaxID=115081 RepID=UPI003FD30444
MRHDSGPLEHRSFSTVQSDHSQEYRQNTHRRQNSLRESQELSDEKFLPEATASREGSAYSFRAVQHHRSPAPQQDNHAAAQHHCRTTQHPSAANRHRQQYQVSQRDKYLYSPICVTGTDAEAAHAIEREEFETAYFDLIDQVEIVIARATPEQSRITTNSPISAQTADTAINIRLPTLQLPSFDGNYSDWVKFKDTFTSVIHENNSLTDIQRFHYLNTSLKGVAARVIQALGVSGTNYRHAWELLKSRYEDSTSLKRHHVNSLLDLKSIQRESDITLREFLDEATNHRIALMSLGESVETWDTMLVPLLSRKLGQVSMREWERRIISQSEMPTFGQFSAFIEERSKYLANIAVSVQVAAPRVDQRPRGTNNTPRYNYIASHVVNSAGCPACKANHAIYNCDKFKNSDLNTKTKIVQEARLCFNCLSSGHRVRACTRSHCKQCGRKHHSLLHNPEFKRAEEGYADTGESDSREPPVLTANVANTIGHAVLSTAIVYVKDKGGQSHKCRVLLDSGSQANFITTAFCQRLGIKPTAISSTVTGLGRAVNSIEGRATLTIHSRYNKSQHTVQCLSIETITSDMPNFQIHREKIEIPSHIELADPEFHLQRPIDMLIGAGLFWTLLCVGQHKSTPNLLLQKTQLGWVLGGTPTWADKKLPQENKCCLATLNDLQSQLERFWDIEELTPSDTRVIDECEAHFRETIRRDTDGRYIVRIPFKSNANELGTSRAQAERRLYSLERRLARYPEKRQQYTEFMSEYETLGHMSRIVEDTHEQSAYYLPHHAVFKEGSTTTKLRVVFNGSAKSSSDLALNDIQLVGPTVQSDLISILIRFRYNRYVLSADIAKMYRQILVHPADRKYQRLLWRAQPHLPVQEYELNTVTYGTASAPFLATRTLHEIGLTCAHTFPTSSKVIINDFYVDDLLTGAQTEQEIETLKGELTQILSQAGMDLRKWASNCPTVTATDSTERNREIAVDKDPKTLGLLWSPTTDHLMFRVEAPQDQRVTKRTILSEIAQIFDPLGLISPIVIVAKLILQQLWQTQTGWDQSIPQNLHSQWLQYRQDISKVGAMNISRCAISECLDDIELHGFSDASEKAYGACVYLRSRDLSGSWVTRLLCAKSRVAPLKTISLPRLELCGALLLANVVNKVRTALDTVKFKEYLWTDSTITLAWLRSSPNKWKTFVANRVSQIQGLTSSDSWRHVASEDNPADLISRGTKPGTLQNTTIWWDGPTWLRQSSSLWPSALDNPIDVPEEKERKPVVLTMSTAESSIFRRFSTYTRLLRSIAYCLRFAKIMRNRVNKLEGDASGSLITGPLTTIEINAARTRLELLAQREAFSTEIRLVQTQQALPNSSALRSLNVFLDNGGLLRVGGRLSNAPIDYDQKHPIILPPRHPLTDLVIKCEHHRLMHAGCQAVLTSLQTRYWLVSAKHNVKRNIRKCVRCFKTNPLSQTYQMGQLPASRVTPARPFITCGVDYAGPFFTKERTRSKVTVKAYLCIFVCFVTKAVHIELATDLSTDAFINCFRRFIARRGRCHCIISDNGTNFIGARNELNILIKDKQHNEKIANALSQESIEWRLIPPHSPHFGGLWEGAVKSAKYHLTRVIGDQRLTFEELYTLLTQIESCLNSRPLSPLSSDPTDLNPLTPGHFLIGTALTTLPSHDLRDIKVTRLNRYQLIQQMVQHFWQRWQRECIQQLQQRHKWQHSTTSKLAVDSLVIIKEDNLPPLQWSMGRIVQSTDHSQQYSQTILKSTDRTLIEDRTVLEYR